MKIFYTLVAIGGIAAAGAAAYWYQNKPPAALVAADDRSGGAAPTGGRAASGGGSGGPLTVEVGRVEIMKLQDETQAVGTLRSRQGVMLRPEVSGRISKLGFGDGQRVARGQLLVQLDDTLQRAQVQQARAQASIARTNLERNRELVAQNFVSKSAVDQTAAAMEVADAQVALAQAQLVRMRIVAPFNGVAGIGSVSVGDYVKDGADLVNIEDTGSMFVDFRLPERVLARLKVGQDVAIALDSLPGRSFAGRVDAFDAQLDSNGRSLLVRAKLDNRDGALRPGMFARARLVFEVRENALVVPEEALVPQGGKQYLLKVVDDNGAKVTQRIEARIGLRVPGKVEILGGVAAGDVVVTAGQARLIRGERQQVKVVDIGASAPAAGEGASAARGGRRGGAASGGVGPAAAASTASSAL
ncbi:MAG: efflux RND transporter periplasmic adaptor subunit [Burkholderiaceae bacterium]